MQVCPLFSFQMIHKPTTMEQEKPIEIRVQSLTPPPPTPSPTSSTSSDYEHKEKDDDNEMVSNYEADEEDDSISESPLSDDWGENLSTSSNEPVPSRAFL